MNRDAPTVVVLCLTSPFMDAPAPDPVIQQGMQLVAVIAAGCAATRVERDSQRFSRRIAGLLGEAEFRTISFLLCRLTGSVSSSSFLCVEAWSAIGGCTGWAS